MTSVWSWTDTSAEPSSLSGSARLTLRRSSSTLVWLFTAATMSAEVTEPNSLPPSPARAVTCTGLSVRRVASS